MPSFDYDSSGKSIAHRQFPRVGSQPLPYLPPHGPVCSKALHLQIHLLKHRASSPLNACSTTLGTHRCKAVDTCTLAHTYTEMYVFTYAQFSSISSSHPSSGPLVSRIRVFPAVQLSAITCPCLTPPWTQKLAHGTLWHRLPHILQWLSSPFPPCPLSPVFHKRKAAKHSMERDWVPFLHMGISFPRIGSLVFAHPDMAVSLFIGKSIASECHGQGQFSAAVGNVPKAYGLEPRTVLLGTSRGVLG